MFPFLLPSWALFGLLTPQMAGGGRYVGSIEVPAGVELLIT